MWEQRLRRRLFPFRKRSLPSLTVDAVIGNQAFSHGLGLAWYVVVSQSDLQGKGPSSILGGGFLFVSGNTSNNSEVFQYQFENFLLKKSFKTGSDRLRKGHLLRRPEIN